MTLQTFNRLLSQEADSVPPLANGDLALSLGPGEGYTCGNTLIKKAGVLVFAIVPENSVQGHLFDAKNYCRNPRLIQAVDAITRNTVRFAAPGSPNKQTTWLTHRKYFSPCYTTRWNQVWTIKA